MASEAYGVRIYCRASEIFAEIGSPGANVPSHV